MKRETLRRYLTLATVLAMVLGSFPVRAIAEAAALDDPEPVALEEAAASPEDGLVAEDDQAAADQPDLAPEDEPASADEPALLADGAETDDAPDAPDAPGAPDAGALPADPADEATIQAELPAATDAAPQALASTPTAIRDALVIVDAPAAGSSSATKPAARLSTYFTNNYTVEWTGWANADRTEREDSFTLAAGETYYALIKLKADTGYYFYQGSDFDLRVNGAELVGSLDFNNYAGETVEESYSVLSMLVAITVPRQAALSSATLDFTAPAAGKASADVDPLTCLSVKEALVIDRASWVEHDPTSDGYQPPFEGTFEEGKTYYCQVKLVDGDDWIAAQAGGAQFDTDLVVNGATKVRQANGAETYIVDEATGEWAAHCMINAIISFTPEKANTHTVTFDLGEYGSTFCATPEAQIVADGEKATEPSYPVRGKGVNWPDGRTSFEGWYTTPRSEWGVSTVMYSTNYFDFNTPITEDITLYAAFRDHVGAVAVDATDPDAYEVMWYSDRGWPSLVKAASIYEEEDWGQYATAFTYADTPFTVTAREMDGWTFKGWVVHYYSEDAEPSAADPIVSTNPVLTGTFDVDKDYYALFESKLITATYDVNGGTKGAEWVDSENDWRPGFVFSWDEDDFEEGLPAEAATAPAGYQFFGFEITDSAGTHTYTSAFEYTVTEDFTVKLLWKPTQAIKTIYIDNTVDNSKSYVTGAVNITGTGGTQAGYNPGKTVYENSASVTYSTPKTAQVQGMIDAAYAQVYKAANDVKARGKSGEFHMSTSTSTGKVWDDRIYDTVEEGDAVLIGDSDYLQGAYGVGTGGYTRTVTSSGDYGKYTYYRVEANGWVAGWDIVVSNDGNGTGEADMEASLAEETVTLTATPAEGYLFDKWVVVSGGAKLADATAASTTFEMPYADVEVQATFIPEHTHTLEKTDEVSATCNEAGTAAYWTCSECGKLFSDEAGTTEIAEPAEIAALGHDWSAWVVDVEPTEEATGHRHRTCSRCDAVEEEILPKLVAEYNCVEGDGATHTIGSGEDLTFVFKRSLNDDVAFERFSALRVDGKKLTDKAFSAEAGSLMATLNAAYLDTLAVGTHTLTAEFEDGEATATFSVVTKAEPAPAPAPAETPATPAAGPRLPQTSDLAIGGMTLVSLALAGAVSLVAGVTARRRED